MTAPVSVRRLIGSQVVDKGKSQGVEFTSLDIVEDCAGHECGLFKVCTHEKRGQCQMQIGFLGSAAGRLLKLAREGSQEDALRIGMLVMPLFLHLVKLKMVEYGSGVLVSTKMGVSVTPIFREIRETVKTISALMKEVGNGSGKKLGGDPSLGDAAWYDALFAEASGADLSKKDSVEKSGSEMDVKNKPAVRVKSARKKK